MEKSKKIFSVIIILLLIAIGRLSLNAQSTPGVYSVTVNTPGTFGQVMLQTVDNWSDVVELTISGHLNSTDMAYFSRMQNITKLDLGQVDITDISGCEGLSLLHTVVLPESVIIINDNAFKDCVSLSTINISQVEEIKSASFSGCTGLTGDLTLPNLKKLGDGAFLGCKGFTTVEMPLATEIGANAFSLQYSSGSDSKLTSVNIPNVKTLGSGAFDCCYNLQSVNLPNVKTIGSGAFQDCHSLTSVTLSDELESIPSYVFNSTGLTTIKLPSALKAIEASAFEYSKLSAVDVPEGVKTIGREAFAYCPLESISLPSTLESIDRGAFYYSTSNNSYVLKDVYCKSVVPLATSTFDNDMVKGATLHVPALSVSAYKLDDNWYKFNKIEAIDGDLSDVTINNTFTVIDYSGLADNANLTLSYSRQAAGHLTVSGNESLSLNNYIQCQYFYRESEGYYDGDKYTYRYSYPYCTTLITNNEVRANNVSTKVLLPTNNWSFISMPYDVNVSSITVPEGIMWVVRKYNGANRAAMSGETWEDVTPGQTLNAGEGYIFHCVIENSDPESTSDEYVEFEFPAVNNSNKNNIFSFDDVVKTIKEFPAEFSHNRGWNLIGNPYPSYFNCQYVDFPAPVTVWDGNGYTAYSLADDEYVLRPNEAFFIQCPVNTNEIKFLKEGRTHNYETSSTPNYSRLKVHSSDSRAILNFILAGEDYSDRTRLVLNETAAYDYEIEKDASKFMSSNVSVPQIYIIDKGINYAIDERPLGSGEYSLGVRIGKEGNYRISLSMNNVDYDVLLIDKETNETINLSENDYSFESHSQTMNNRFVIKVASKSGMSSIDNVTENTKTFSVNGHQLTVDKGMTISIHSVDGKIIYEGIPDGYVELPSGIYLLSIGNITHKIAIK